MQPVSAEKQLKTHLFKNTAHQILVKSTPVVNFIIIYKHLLSRFPFFQKITIPDCKHQNAVQNTFVQKTAREMLVKLTPGRSLAFVPRMVSLGKLFLVRLYLICLNAN